MLQKGQRGSYITRAHGDLDADFDVDLDDVQILLDNEGCQASPPDDDDPTRDLEYGSNDNGS
jgi:hypothetical protein